MYVCFYIFVSVFSPLLVGEKLWNILNGYVVNKIISHCVAATTATNTWHMANTIYKYIQTYMHTCFYNLNALRLGPFVAPVVCSLVPSPRKILTANTNTHILTRSVKYVKAQLSKSFLMPAHVLLKYILL